MKEIVLPKSDFKKFRRLHFSSSHIILAASNLFQHLIVTEN